MTAAARSHMTTGLGSLSRFIQGLLSPYNQARNGGQKVRYVPRNLLGRHIPGFLSNTSLEGEGGP